MNSTMLRTRVLAPLACAALVVAAAGCGGGSHDSTAAKSISAAMLKDDSTIKLKKSQADCVGKKMVDKVGADNLKKAGLLDSNYKVKGSTDNLKLSKSDADKAADAVVDCVNVSSLIEQAMGSEASSMPASAKACMKKVFTKDAMHDLLAASFSGDTSGASTTNLESALTKCVSSASQ